MEIMLHCTRHLDNVSCTNKLIACVVKSIFSFFSFLFSSYCLHLCCQINYFYLKMVPNISHDSASAHFRCIGLFSNLLIANLLLSLGAKK